MQTEWRRAKRGRSVACPRLCLTGSSVSRPVLYPSEGVDRSEDVQPRASTERTNTQSSPQESRNPDSTFATKTKEDTGMVLCFLLRDDDDLVVAWPLKALSSKPQVSNCNPASSSECRGHESEVQHHPPHPPPRYKRSLMIRGFQGFRLTSGLLESWKT